MNARGWKPARKGQSGRSATRRKQARQAITEWNARRHLLPKCGAKARHTGEPCRQLAMANGRCHYHGGATPRGAKWHKPLWPDRDSPSAMRKLNGKVLDRERAAKQRAARLARMTPEERAAHDEWQRTHKPGRAEARTADRERRRQAKAARELLARPEKPPAVSDELRELERQAEQLRRFLASIDPGESR